MPDGFTLSNRKTLDPTAPRAGTGQGGVCSIATSVTPAQVLLSTCPAPVVVNTAVQGSGQDSKNGIAGQSITLEAVTTDLCVIFGPTLASVSTATLAMVANGTISAAGAYVPPATQPGLRIFNGQPPTRINLKPTDLWMAFVATGAGQIIFFQSSDSSP
jgi:hypothetical protein